MKLNEIKAAVLAGKTVHWKNGAYRVIFDPTRGSVVAGFLIECVLNGDCIGLTWTNGVTMNGEESDFFIAPERLVATFRKPCGGVVVDKDTYHEPMAEALEAAEEDAHRYGWELLGVEVTSNI
jgi:hypothetical protein